jgi:hypothetical protein
MKSSAFAAGLRSQPLVMIRIVQHAHLALRDEKYLAAIQR